MQREDNIYVDALPRLAEGIRKATRLVEKTMGPRGTNGMREIKLYPYTEISNDGATLIKAIELADPIERMGLSLLKEAADRSNNNSGDGSTTTAVLLNSILEEGIRSGINSLQLKHELDECLPIIEESIAKQTKQITVEDISSVARIAGESEQLADILGKIYRDIGKDGIVHLEGSGSYETTYSIINGVRFTDTGYLSPYMAYDEDDGKIAKKALYHKPAVLITKNKITKVDDIDPLIGALIAKGTKTLVIFTDDMDSNVARILIELQRNEKRSINILIIKAPILWKGHVFEDFAKITGATIIEDASGTKLGKHFQLDWLGTCDTIICDKEETTVIGIQDISDHIKSLEEEETTDAKLRLSWLTTKTAILKLGAKSETELSYLRLKAEDAIFSSRAALKHGIVPGGGICLRNAAKSMPDTIGSNILAKALKAPIKQIFENSAPKGRGEMSFDELEEHLKTNPVMCYDAKTSDLVEDAFKAGIVDASTIVLGAIRNALGIASTLLTTSSVIILPPKSLEEIANQAMMRPMMGM